MYMSDTIVVTSRVPLVLSEGLDSLAKDKKTHDPDLRALATLINSDLAERRRLETLINSELAERRRLEVDARRTEVDVKKAETETKRADDLEKKVEALKNIEKGMIQRDATGEAKP